MISGEGESGEKARKAHRTVLPTLDVDTENELCQGLESWLFGFGESL